MDDYKLVELDYTKPNMTREETLEAMLKACIDVIEDHGKAAMLPKSKIGVPRKIKFTFLNPIRKYINHESQV